MSAGAEDQEGRASESIIVTRELRLSIRAQIKRTDITAIRLLKGRRDLPRGLDARTVNRWASGLGTTALKAQFNYVMQLWAALPDHPGRATDDGRKLSVRGARHAAEGETRIPVTAEMSAQLRDELVRTGTPPASTLRGLDEQPEGLNQRVVYGWLHGEIASADRCHWEFVIKHLRMLPTITQRAKLRKPQD